VKIYEFYYRRSKILDYLNLTLIYLLTLSNGLYSAAVMALVVSTKLLPARRDRLVLGWTEVSFEKHATELNSDTWRSLRLKMPEESERSRARRRAARSPRRQPRSVERTVVVVVADSENLRCNATSVTHKMDKMRRSGWHACRQLG